MAEIATRLWEAELPPVSFRLAGRESAALLPHWAAVETVADLPDGRVRRLSWTAPGECLELCVEMRAFDASPAVEWVAYLRNDGDAVSPLIEDICALDTEAQVGDQSALVHHARGSNFRADDFEPLSAELSAGTEVTLKTYGGRSSQGYLPFFNLQVGDGGVIGAIGWSGNWRATFARDGNGRLAIRAGMQRTSLVLRPGEVIRTPRILLLDWRGDRAAAHNTWRRLLLAHFVPQVAGAPVRPPACYAVWGTDRIDHQVAKARAIHELGVPFDVFWVDAGWYGNEPYRDGSNVYNSTWHRNQGNWWPAPECYPEGLAPLGAALAELGFGFLLWVEPEVAKEGTTLWTEHPEWFLTLPGNGSAVLNLGDPAARQGITDLLSDIIETAQLAWYRQDFNIDPEPFWAAHDEPDRIGMTELRYVEGLYACWDELLARHPGLRIDNCSSGGRRIDLETMRRSVPLWRSDYTCIFGFDPIGAQAHTHGLAPWVPLSAGVCGKPDTYAWRSGYSPGIVVDSCTLPVSAAPAEWWRAALDEFHELQPLQNGDFYALAGYSLSTETWAAWQFDRPELGAGAVVLLRRQDSPYATFQCRLRGLDPAAAYLVEVRQDLGPVAPVTMSGAALAELEVRIVARPGSTVVFYRRA